MSEPIHHLNKRKRIHEKHELYPHPNKFKFILDKTIYIVGILGPLFGAMQTYKIWSEKNATGVSLALFGSHIIFNAIWILYGTIHKEKPIILMYTLWLIINISIVLGTMLYG